MAIRTGGQNLGNFGVDVNVDARSVDDLSKKIGRIGANFNTQFARANQQGLRHVANQLQNINKTYNKQLKQTEDRIRRLQRQEAAATTAKAREQFKAQRKLAEAKIDQIEEEYKLRTKRQNKLLDDQKDAADEIRKLREKESGLIGKGHKAGRLMSGAAGGVATIQGALDSGDFASVFEDLGDTLGKRIAFALEKSGAKGGAMAGLSGVLSKIGPAIVALGAVVGGLAAVVKLVMDADAQTKEFNNAILDGVAPVDAMVDRTKSLDQNMAILRGTALGTFDLFNKFRVESKEQVEIMNALAQAGHTFKDMAGDAKTAEEATRRYNKAVEQTLVYARVLGMTNTEMAETQGRMMEEMGVGLATIGDQFNNIYNAAQLSGMGTKRFFSHVLQATSGMSLYNTQLDTTGGLLSELSTLLDPERAAEFVKNLQGGYGSESLEDSAARVLKSGRGTSRKVLKAEANMQRQRLTQMMQKEGTGGMFLDALKAAGIKGDVGSATTGQREKLSKYLTDQGKDGQKLLKHVDRLIDLQKGANGGVLAQAKALEQLGPGGKLAMQLNTYMGKPFHKLSNLQLIAAEKQFGIDREQRMELVKISRNMEANWKAIQDGDEATLKKFGLTKGPKGITDAAGNKVDKTTFQTMMGKQVAEVMKGKGTPAEQTAKFAQEIAGATKQYNILGKASEVLLSKIAGLIEGIYDMMASLPMFKDTKHSSADLNSIRNFTKGASLSAIEQLGVKASGTDDASLKKTLLHKQKILSAVRFASNTAAVDRDGVKAAGSAGAFIANQLRAQGLLTEGGEKGAEILRKVMEGNLDEVAKLRKDLPDDFAEAQIKAQRKENTKTLLRAGVKVSNPDFQKYLTQLNTGTVSSELSTLLNKNVKNAAGLYIPDGGNTAYRLAPDDNIVAWRRGEQGAAARAVGGGGSVGGNVNLTIITDNPQRVYSAVKDVLRQAGIRAPAAGGVN